MDTKKRLQKFMNSWLIQDLTSDKDQTHTKHINPKLGLLGILGVLGFAGFFPESQTLFNPSNALTAPIFFFFFGFFGFFGFYYQGKMSDTLIDERFLANANRAAAVANKICLILIFAISIFTISVFRINAYHMLGIFIALIGLVFGLSSFLQAYLLYRFENEE